MNRRPFQPRSRVVSRTTVTVALGLLMLGALLAFGVATIVHGLLDSPKQTQAGTPSSSAASSDPYRPAFHITPASKWMNDPQRPIFLNGLWHFYYLYNGDFPSGNGTEWRHLTSPDLVHWIDRGTAIRKYENGLGDIETGSTVIDRTGAAGHGKNAVIAIATQQADGVQRQSLFYSTDGGFHFHSDPGNPIMENPGVPDWRDPKIIWDGERSQWVLALAEGNKIGIYTSTDLRQWAYRSGVSAEGIGTVECPDLFQLDLDGDPAESTWVLAVSANRSSSGGTTGFAYWTGEFDGATFTRTQPAPQWLDSGPDFYAAVTWAKPGSHSARYALAWMNNWSYAKDAPTTAWHGGADTIPRQIRLETQKDGSPRLVSKPITPPSHTTPISATRGSATLDVSSLHGGFVASVDLAAGDSRFRLRSRSGAYVDISYDAAEHRLTLDRAHDSFGVTPTANHTYRARYAMRLGGGAETVRLTFVVDRSSLEVFSSSGDSMTAQVYLAGGALSLADLSTDSASAPFILRRLEPAPVSHRD